MGDITLEKIDVIRERTGVTYKEAKEVLEKHDGNLVDALIYLEENQKSWAENITSNLNNTGDRILEVLRETLRKGNVTKIVIKKDGETIMNIPITAGAIGAILSPHITAIGVTAALVSKCTIEVVKENGEIVNINEMAEKTVEKVKKTVQRDKKNTDDDMDNNDEE